MPQATLLERGLQGAASYSPLMIEMALNGPSTLLRIRNVPSDPESRAGLTTGESEDECKANRRTWDPQGTQLSLY